MILTGKECIDRVAAFYDYLPTICLQSNTVEVFQRTRLLDGQPVVAISYESEGFCCPVTGVHPNEAFQVISRIDERTVIKLCQRYRAAKESLKAMHIFEVEDNDATSFFAEQCASIHKVLADEYNILVDQIFLDREVRGFIEFDTTEAT